MKMIEASLKEEKEEKEIKEKEWKELLKRCMSMKKEIEKLSEDKKKSEKELNGKIRKLTKQLNEKSKEAPVSANGGNSQVSAQVQIELEKHLIASSKEIESKNQEISILKVQLEGSQRLNEELKQSCKTMEESKLAIQKNNSVLSESQKRSDQRAEKLEERLEKFMIYEKIFESSSQIEWVHCKELITANAFKSHMKIWPPQQEMGLSLPPLKLKLVSSNLTTDEKDGYKLREYVIEVDYRKREYKVTKRINLFLGLYDSLEDHFPSLKMPDVPELFELHWDDRHLLKEEGVYADDFSDPIIELLKFFCLNAVVRESIFFKKFLEIDKQFPDEFASKKHAPRTRQTIGLAQSHSNFDLMPDGYASNMFSPKNSTKVTSSLARQRNIMNNSHSPNGNDSMDTDDDECVIEEKNIDEYLP